ncbi:TlpA family protein disulfide reductase [Flavihumibacter fluvii]|uniref:TlpA family protein disulfide reductase n=1 Tax=Flavihumibacter fluvii TaxID=2838157 RepID=UPI001BDED5A1|nr:redoxin domain-containing protein [Flavihumibacter fluvii]ULQ53081.1 redoxin domain-containing protein [Flavihumibacter fluvii]
MKTFRQIIYAGLIGLILSADLPSFAQNTAANPPAAYLRYPTIPPFELKALDGKTIKRDNLANRQGTLIIFFSPDCHHCIDQMEQMVAQAGKFQQYNLVFATYQPMNELQLFYTKYNLSTWKNLYIGRDEKFFFPPYFKIVNLPFNALYDKKGNLITTFEGTTAMDKLLNGFAKK